LAFANATFAAKSWIIEGRVVAIADGDTITILDRDKHQHKIRFNGIAAADKKRPFKQRSRQNLATLTFDRNVRAECKKKDRSGREVCKVLDGSRDLGLEQVNTELWGRLHKTEAGVEVTTGGAKAVAMRVVTPSVLFQAHVLTPIKMHMPRCPIVFG
jgi:hypothetical protein